MISMRILDFPVICFNTFSERLDVLLEGFFVHWKGQTLKPQDVAEGRPPVTVTV